MTKLNLNQQRAQQNRLIVRLGELRLETTESYNYCRIHVYLIQNEQKIRFIGSKDEQYFITPFAAAESKSGLFKSKVKTSAIFYAEFGLELPIDIKDIS